MRRKGIALITVLTMCGILVLMLTAFIQLHRDQFALVVADQHHEAALDAAKTAAEYCTYRIERDRKWGAGKFKNAHLQTEIDRGLKLKILEDTRNLEGEVLSTGARFEVNVLNNLKGTAAWDGVPAGKCRLRIVGSRGMARVRRELLLCTSPLFDSGVVSSMGINIAANKLRVGSRDPLRNRLRSKKEIIVPDYQTSLEFPTGFAANASRAGGANNYERGLLWAKTGIRTQSNQDLSDPEEAQKASAKTGGKFIPKATTNYEIHDLKLQDLAVPDNDVVIPEGMYVFTDAPVTYTTLSGDTETRNVRMLQRRTGAVVDENGMYTGGNIEEYWYLKSDFPANGEPGWPQSTTGDTAVAHIIDNTAPGVTDTSFEIFSGITANLNLNSININPDLHVIVNGDFGVATEVQDRTPVVQFKTQTGEYRTGAITSAGNILIEGFVYGSGKIAAKGDVTLRPNAASLSTDEATEISIYSGNDVRIRRPKTVTGSDGDFYFNGLIYAKNNVLFDGARGTGTGRNVTIEGAVVARDGRVVVEGVNEATMIYNPAYLDSLVKELSGDHTRVERFVWKET